MFEVPLIQPPDKDSPLEINYNNHEFHVQKKKKAQYIYFKPEVALTTMGSLYCQSGSWSNTFFYLEQVQYTLQVITALLVYWDFLSESKDITSRGIIEIDIDQVHLAPRS